MLIVNARMITWGEQNQILEGQALRLTGELINEIGPEQDLLVRYPNEKRLDASGQYVMPGNICAHTHFYGAFARGLAIPGQAPKDFPEILQKLWWPLDKSLSIPDVQASTEVMLLDAIRHGTTTLIDHHASQNAIDGSLDVIANAVDQSGLRAVLCYEVTDRDGKEKAQEGIRENVRFMERVRRETPAGGRVAATFGLHASLTLSEETLAACREANPAGEGFHIHVAEHEADEYDSLAKTGLRIVDRLREHGILGPRTITAHAVHVDAREIVMLADTETWVSHQPRSNMNNGVGVADVESLLRSGARVCLGTDGFSHTMWQEWKAAYLLQKVWNRDPRRLPGDAVARMGAVNNAKLASLFFPGSPADTLADILAGSPANAPSGPPATSPAGSSFSSPAGSTLGVLEPGAFADLIFVDYRPPTPLTPDNLPWHIIFGFDESMITTTIVSGKVLMRDRQVLTMDEEAIYARVRALSPAVWERYQEFVP